MKNGLEYIIWYHKLFGKTLKGRKSLEYYGSYEAMYEAVVSGKEQTGLLTSAPVGKYTSFSLFDAEDIINVCEDNGWHIIPCTSDEYPSELKEIKDYPHILFADGKKEVLTMNVKFAIVGSREAASDAEVIAYNSAYNLASTGAVIVSGAAVGIDSAAHLGAVQSGGYTIGVLGCGIGNRYMAQISDFYDEVKQSGVYISELFPYENNTRSSFPDRNRLISGLSRGVLVACAAKGSGSLNTARHAKGQGRSIFVPAPEICYSDGCEQLLEDGAYSFYNAGDIAYPNREYYKDGTFDAFYCNKPVTVRANNMRRENMALPKRGKKGTSSGRTSDTAEPVQRKKEAPAQTQKGISEDIRALLSEDAIKVYEAIGDGAVSTESLVGSVLKDVISVQIALSELEGTLLIKFLPGGRVQKL